MTKDHIEELAKKYNMSEEQIKLILNNFWTGFRYYMTHPLESKGGIHVKGLFTLWIDTWKVQEFIERLKRQDIRTIRKQQSVEFYEQLLRQLKKYERQKSKTNDSTRSSGTIQE